MLAALGTAERRRLVAAMKSIERLLSPRADGAAAADGARARLVLRAARSGELGWIVHRHGALYASEYGWREKFEGLVARVAGDFLSSHDPKRERCWVAELDGEIVGSIMLVKTSARVAKLRLLLVEPSARGLGVGRRLVEECVGVRPRGRLREGRALDEPRAPRGPGDLREDRVPPRSDRDHARVRRAAEGPDLGAHAEPGLKPDIRGTFRRPARHRLHGILSSGRPVRAAGPPAVAGLRRRGDRHARPRDGRDDGDLLGHPGRPARAAALRRARAAGDDLEPLEVVSPRPGSRRARSRTTGGSSRASSGSRPGSRTTRTSPATASRCASASPAVDRRTPSRPSARRCGSAATSPPEEDRDGGAPVVVLGYGLWQNRYGGDPDVLGRSIELDGVARRVVGVMPRGFALPTDFTVDAAEPSQLWFPPQIDPASTDHGSHGYYGAAKLKPGARRRSARRAELKIVTTGADASRACIRRTCASTPSPCPSKKRSAAALAGRSCSSSARSDS